MLIGKFRHKGLQALYYDDDPSGLPAASVRKISRILSALEFAEDLAQLAMMPGWKLHPLKGARKGEYSMTITGNWRITFIYKDHAVTDLNFEDYH